jgi:Spx/MgsR family transcriptional regulator
MSQLVVHGLKNCDGCRKALAQLRAAGVEHRFVDYRAEPIEAATLLNWSQQLGGFASMINRSGSTWRQLSEEQRTVSTPQQWLALLAQYPALLRRPLVLLADRIHIGLPPAVVA